MTFANVITTFTGGFIFAFLVRMCWGKMNEDWGSIGGWMAAGFIVAATWTLNHGVGFIVQSGPAWIDMAWASGPGLFAASLASGESGKNGLVNAAFALIGGTIGGYVLSCLNFFH
ncbi:MAG: hypothetical protein N4A68_18850 [Maledivibacter sp.]|jgi:hypothetical protein|nr:hypothetical protein [Maledivibacter sp.]